MSLLTSMYSIYYLGLRGFEADVILEAGPTVSDHNFAESLSDSMIGEASGAGRQSLNSLGKLTECW